MAKEPMGVGGPTQPSERKLRLDQDANIRWLLADERRQLLTDWEQSFISSIYGEETLTRKQKACLARIRKRVGANNG